ncbi:unnamed protein product [Trichobilharzia regenti]|nr:unnamed protein product [Trichobilharzia regenti]
MEPHRRVYLTRSSCSPKDKNRPTFDIRYHLIVYLDHSIVATYDLYRKRTYIYYTELNSNFYFWSHNSGNIVLFAFRPLSTHQNQYFRVEINMLPLHTEWLSNVNMLDFNLNNYHKNDISVGAASVLVNFRLKFKRSASAPIEFKINSNESLQLYQLYSNILMNTSRDNDANDSNNNVKEVNTYLDSHYNQLIKITNQLINYEISNPLLISDLMDELIILESEYQMHNASEGIFSRKKNTLQTGAVDDSTYIQTAQLALIRIIPIGSIMNITCKKTWKDYYDYNSSILINTPHVNDYTTSLLCEMYDNNQLNSQLNLINPIEFNNQDYVHFAIVPKEIYQSLVERQQNKYDLLFGNANVRKYYSQYFTKQKHPIIRRNQSIGSQNVLGHYSYDNHLGISVSNDHGLWSVHMLRLSTMKFTVIICSLVVVASLILFIIREIIKIRRLHNIHQDSRTSSALSILRRSRVTESTTPAAGEMNRSRPFPPPLPPPPRCSSVDIYDIFRNWLYPSLANTPHGTGDETVRHPGMPNRQRRNAQSTTNSSSHLINAETPSASNPLNGGNGNSSSSSSGNYPQQQSLSTPVQPHRPNHTEENGRSVVNQMKQTDQATRMPTTDFHDLPPSYELVEKLKQLKDTQN